MAISGIYIGGIYHVLEVPTICKAYVREYPHKIWTNMYLVPPFEDPEIPIDDVQRKRS